MFLRLELKQILLLKKGDPYFKQAQQIVTLAQQNGIAGGINEMETETVLVN